MFPFYNEGKMKGDVNMNKIKNLFSTPKKSAVTVICIIAVLALLGTCTAFAAGSIAQSSSIGEENAKNFAFADAGIDPVSAQQVKAEFDFEQGQFVYEVEFTADGAEYKYWIKASDGSVVKKEADIVRADGSKATATAKITMDEAVEIALADAGLKLSDVKVVKQELDLEDGVSVYDIEFAAGNTEYEYEIDSNTGKVFFSKNTVYANDVTAPNTANGTEQSDKTAANPDNTGNTGNKTDAGNTGSTGSSGNKVNTGSAGNTGSTGGNSSKPTSAAQANGGANQNKPAASQISLEEAKKAALANAGLSASQVKFIKAAKDYEDGIAVYEIEFYTSTQKYEYEIKASDGSVYKKEVEPLRAGGSSSGSAANTTANSGSQGGSASGSASYIGVDRAKSIALNHAGFSASDVTFVKAKLDHDDGYAVYEIEFYKGTTEYEYTINAVSGKIMDYEYE